MDEREAAGRLLRDGPNVPPRPPPVRWWRRVGRQLADPLIVVLLVAASLTAVIGDRADMAVILLVIVVNTAVGVTQEIRADREISALADLTAPDARVIRAGRREQIPSADVVVGDLLVLAEGDIVTADGTVLEAARLMVEESALTGESAAVEKAPGEAVWAGTVAVRGRGTVEVTATGASSATGRIAGSLRASAPLTPLQRRLIGVGRALAAVAVVLCALVLVLGVVRGQPAGLMLVTAISLVVAAVPESLPAVVTVGLALGARRMSARAALVRRLPAVETLGSVTVIATDKTGTLTEGRMAVARAWTVEGAAEIHGAGHAPESAVGALGGGDLTPKAREALEALLAAAALCNDAQAAYRNGEWEALGDPTEAALVVAAARAGLDPETLRAACPRVAEIPFDSARKRMTTVHEIPGGFRVVLKGAPEVLLRPDVLTDGPEVRARALQEADRSAREGLRVLAVAAADRATDEPDETGLGLLGLVALHDPPRASAARTLAECRAAGIRPVLITGDHPGTARSVAAALGLIHPGDPVVDCRTGEPAAGAGDVFARASPEQKLALIEDLRSGGETVAMTGDGVNDAPALRRADIGVAMGVRGTEVARQAADLVLADDELSTLVVAVQEGRRVYRNIRRFLVYGLSGGTAEIAVMLLGPLCGLALPLTPGQILWINLLTHGIPGVALGGEPAEDRDMRRPPRPPSESILGAGLWQRVLRIAVVLTAITLAIALWAEQTGRPWQTLAFFTLGSAQLWAALGSRTTLRTRENPLLPAAVAAAFALQTAAVYLPLLQDLLGTRPLTLPDLCLAVALSSLGYVTVRLDRRLHPERVALSASAEDV
ncbi:cation-translocating P-type ATPase [Actinocorallia aurea]